MIKKQNFKSLILHEDDNYLFLNKPAGIATLADRANPYQDMLTLAKSYHNEIQVAHRLDKETSGVLAFAKHPKAYRSLCMQFENRTIKKTYHGVVEGVHQFFNEKIDLPIYINKKNHAFINYQEGKSAITVFHTLKIYWGYTLLSFQPQTGKTHQIRIHTAFKKAPLVGDLQYGGHPFYLSSLKKNYQIKKNTEELPLMQRVALHAYELELNSITGEKIIVNASYPKDFYTLTHQLQKNSEKREKINY